MPGYFQEEVYELGSVGGVQSDGVRFLTRSWVVRTDKTDSAAIAVDYLVTEGVVKQYEPHPDFAPCIAIECDPQRIAPGEWRITWRYSSGGFSPPFGGGLPLGTTLDPADPRPTQQVMQATNNDIPAQFRPVMVRRSKKDITDKALLKDVNGDPLLNYAGDPFEGYNQLYGHMVYDLTWWTFSITDEHCQDYWYTVNNAEWFGKQAGTCLVTDFTFDDDQQNIGGGVHGLIYKVHLQIEWAPTPHLFEVDNTGRRKKVTLPLVGQVHMAILDASGQPVDAPVALKPDGSDALPPGESPYPYVREIYKKKSFAGIII